jgi:sulfite exporter TauE/SafE/copper chaperone CopZ
MCNRHGVLSGGNVHIHDAPGTAMYTRFMSRLLIWPVQGMHCASCEQIIAAELSLLEGVEEVEVSVRRARAGIRLSDQAPTPNCETLNRAFASHGYVLLPPTVDTKAIAPSSPVCELPTAQMSFSTRFGQALLALAGVVLFFRWIWTPLSHLVPTLTAQTSVFALIGFGVVASLSTCLASTGAFLLAYATQRSTKSDLLWLHAGRLLAFVVGGAVLGTVGSLWSLSSHWSGIMSIGLGVGFLLVGLHLLNLSPSLASFGLHLPSRWYQGLDRFSKRQGRFASVVVGAATFILPCGFTQTAQTLALASGSATRGALFLGAFALGTLPTLLGVTFFGSAAALKQRAFRLVSGAILLLFSITQVDGGLTVLGAPLTIEGAAARLWTTTIASVMPTPVEAQEQVVRMTVAYGTFSPNRFVIRRGIPVRWEVKGLDISGCASTLIAPTLGLRQDLILGSNTISFTPKEKGEIPFSCSMGMIRGSFTVVE